MPSNLPIKQLAAISILLAISTHLHAANSLTLQYGSDLEDQSQQFISASFPIQQLGYLDISMGHSDYEATPIKALNLGDIGTDYASFGYASPSDTDISFGLAYDYWEMNSFKASSYTADLWYQTGNWSFGLHPEQHEITFKLDGRPALEYSSIGGGISVGYFTDNNLFLYAAHYRYRFNAPEILERRQTLPLRLEIALRLVNEQISSKLDDTRSNLGFDYYFENASIGIEKQQIKTVIDGGEYEITTINGSLLIGEHWQTGLSVSRTKGVSNGFYNASLGYHW